MVVHDPLKREKERLTKSRKKTSKNIEFPIFPVIPKMVSLFSSEWLGDKCCHGNYIQMKP